jgi:pyruvate formate lyase activating enzyme
MAICPTNALEVYGKDMTTEAIMEAVLKDKLFYETSNGGVTLSGGEPLFQEVALKELLTALKSEGLHVALDTSGHVKWQVLEDIQDSVDIFLYDLKHLDPDQHRQATGVSVTDILENYKRLHGSGARIWVRLPMIPNYNMDQEQLSRLIDLLRLYPPEQVNLLPYHGVASRKYELLGIPMGAYKKDEDYESALQHIQQVMTAAGLKCLIGG